MRSFRLHLGFIFPLIIICICAAASVILHTICKDYEERLGKDYSVVIVAKQTLKNEEFSQISGFLELSELSTQKLIEQVKNDLSAKNLSDLEAKLPHFYSLKFKHFLSFDELEKIKLDLAKITKISQIHTFSKTHIKVYHLLSLVNAILLACTLIIAALATTLFFKQISIWLYQNEERIYILNLFGANFFQRAKSMLALVFIDNLICFLLLILLLANYAEIAALKDFFASIDIDLPRLSYFQIAVKIALASLIASLFCVIAVMLKVRRR